MKLGPACSYTTPHKLSAERNEDVFFSYYTTHTTSICCMPHIIQLTLHNGAPLVVLQASVQPPKPASLRDAGFATLGGALGSASPCPCLALSFFFFFYLQASITSGEAAHAEVMYILASLRAVVGARWSQATVELYGSRSTGRKQRAKNQSGHCIPKQLRYYTQTDRCVTQTATGHRPESSCMARVLRVGYNARSSPILRPVDPTS